MSKKTSHRKGETVRKENLDLRLTVLQYLQEYGSTPWNVLYFRFNQRKTAEIGSALQELTQRNHIELVPGNKAKITPSGREQLKRETGVPRRSPTPTVTESTTT